MSCVFGNQTPPSHDQINPIGNGFRHLNDKVLKRAVLQLSITVEAVVCYPAQIRFGLLHYRHIEKYTDLPKLMVGPESANSSGRSRDDRPWLFVPNAVTIWSRPNINRVF